MVISIYGNLCAYIIYIYTHKITAFPDKSIVHPTSQWDFYPAGNSRRFFSLQSWSLFLLNTELSSLVSCSRIQYWFDTPKILGFNIGIQYIGLPENRISQNSPNPLVNRHVPHRNNHVGAQPPSSLNHMQFSIA